MSITGEEVGMGVCVLDIQHPADWCCVTDVKLGGGHCRKGEQTKCQRLEGIRGCWWAFHVGIYYLLSKSHSAEWGAGLKLVWSESSRQAQVIVSGNMTVKGRLGKAPQFK